MMAVVAAVHGSPPAQSCHTQHDGRCTAPAELQGRLAAKEGDMQLELASRVTQVGRVGVLEVHAGQSLPTFLPVPSAADA